MKPDNRTYLSEINGDGDATTEQDVVVIREIYENNSAEEYFENELERALVANVKLIVIEPSKLGDETARWIYVGNCLHKTAVLSGVSSIATALYWPDTFFSVPLTVSSLICAGVYAVSWQFDPCCKYQVESDMEKIKQRVSQNLTSSSPVVLTRRNDTRRKFLHNTIAMACVGLTTWQVYQWYIK